LTEEMIQRWARAHKARTGRCPKVNAGEVMDAQNENWRALDSCLRYGQRGLLGGSSLRRMMIEAGLKKSPAGVK